jgi:hypothetical protein
MKNRTLRDLTAKELNYLIQQAIALKISRSDFFRSIAEVDERNANKIIGKMPE